jgi:hypothetical protein
MQIPVLVGFSPHAARILTQEGPDKMSARSYRGSRYIQIKYGV